MGSFLVAALPFISLLAIMGVSELMTALEARAHSIDSLRSTRVVQTISPQDDQRPYDWAAQDEGEFDLRWLTFWNGDPPNI